MNKFVALVFLGIIYVASTGRLLRKPVLQEWTGFLTKIERDCINITKIDNRIIEKTRVTLELPDEPEYKKYISCFYKKQGYQNEDGDILFYNLKNMIIDLSNSSLATAVVNDCKDTPRMTSHEDYAFAVAKCLLEDSKQKMLPLD